MKLTDKVPAKSGLYWCRYISLKHDRAKRTSVALVEHFKRHTKDDEYVINIFLGGSFTCYDYQRGEAKKFKIKFGDPIDIPSLWPTRKKLTK